MPKQKKNEKNSEGCARRERYFLILDLIVGVPGLDLVYFDWILFRDLLWVLSIPLARSHPLLGYFDWPIRAGLKN